MAYADVGLHWIIFVFINESPRGKVQASRGLRQGDLLPPFLFLLVVDVLSKLVSKWVVCNLIGPFEVGEDKIPFSRLRFADDTLFLCSRSGNSFLMLNHILVFFEEMLGLKIKSEEDKIKRWVEWVGKSSLFLSWPPSWD